MNLNKFEKYLICPCCHSRLKRKEDKFICFSKNHVYKIVGEIPVFLDRIDKKDFSKEINNAAWMQREYKGNYISKLIKISKKIIGSCLHLPVSQKVKKIWNLYRNERSLEIGSGVTKKNSKQINLDIDIFSGVDIVASATNIPFKNNTFKLIRNIAVLEHVDKPILMVDEIFRVLKPKGYVYTEVPFLQHFHGYPNDFQRYTTEGLKKLFHRFKIIETGVCVGPSSAVTTMIAGWFELFSFSQRRLINDLFRLIPLMLLLPIKYLDYILVKNPRAHEVASGIYMLCQKPKDR